MWLFKKLNLCDGFVGLWCLYYLQNILYPQGFINQSVQLLMIVLGFVPFCRCFVARKNPLLVKALLLLVMMYIIYGLLVILFGDGVTWTDDSTYLKSTFNSLLPVFFFYEQTRQGNLTERRIRIYTVIMLVVSIVFFNYMSQALSIEYDRDENTNNAGYMFAGLLPLVFLFHKKPVMQYALLAIMMVYVLMSMKRGAIIISALVVVLFLYSGLKGRGLKRKVFVLLLSAVIVLGTIKYVEYLLVNSPYFLRRVNDTMAGDGSERDFIYNAVWNAVVKEPNLFYILFGHGANSTILYAGNFAHQDWLETACNNGLVGVFILAFFFLAFAITVCKCRRYFEPQYYYCFLSILVIVFSETMFSMSIQSMSACLGMLIGYFICCLSAQKQRKLE